MRNLHDGSDADPRAFCKSSISGVHQIVRLRQMVQQWRRRAPVNLDRTLHAMSPRGAKKFMRGSSSSASAAGGNAEQAMELPPEGYLAVYVGCERRRFVIRTEHINHPLFHALLDRTEEEFGLINRDGGLALPACEVVFFEHMLWMVESHYLDHLHDVHDRTELRELLDFYHVGMSPAARNVSCLQEANDREIMSSSHGDNGDRSASAITQYMNFSSPQSMHTYSCPAKTN